VKKVVVLLFVGLWAASCPGVVAAQEMLVAPKEMEVEGPVPDLALPPMSDSPSTEEGLPPGSEESWLSEEEDTGQLAPYPMDEYNMFPCDPMLLESTGTWLRRGFWYSEVDAMLLNRQWRRDPYILIQQQVGFIVRNTVQGPIAFPTFNSLTAFGNKPGVEVAPRLTLGRFLFRDHRNRDHVAEFTIYGGGEWTQDGQLNANPDNAQGTTTLSVPTETDEGNASFDGATTSQFRYDTRFNSFELNYLVKDRMGRDHMEMDPSGHWVRRAGPSVSLSMLAGFRYFDLNESLVWTASDFEGNTDLMGDVGSVNVETDNDMFGTQAGFGWFYETARWSLGARAKSGFANIIDVSSSSTVPTADATVVSDKTFQNDQISFITEASLLAKWHIQPNLSFRAGLEALHVARVALAPYNISFVPGGAANARFDGDPVFLGGLIGFEGYW
jgi:hypothetical protein